MPEEQQQTKPETIWAGYESYSGGINASARNHRELGKSQLAGAVNATMRDGWIRPRDGYRWIPVKSQRLGVQDDFSNGAMQGACYYERGNTQRVVFAVSGRLYSFNPLTGYLSKVSVPDQDQPLQATAPHVYLCQRSDMLVARDGISMPVIVSGSSARIASKKANEVFGGTVMADGWGWLLAVSRDGRRLYISDHEADPNNTPISFNESTAYYLNAQYFQTAHKLGPIVAMCFLPYVDTASGLGPVAVLCRRATMTFDVSAPRPAWITSNIAHMTLPKVGACAHRAVVATSADLLFRDQSGRIRSLASSIASLKSLSVRQIDREVKAYLEMEDKALREHAQACDWNERVLFTTQPQRVRATDGNWNHFHRGVLTFNQEVVASLNETLPPIWEGVSTGLNFETITTGIFDDREHLIFSASDPDGRRRIYEQVPGQAFDITPDKQGTAPVRKSIQWSFETRWFDFGVLNAFKSLVESYARMEDIRGPVSIKASYRTSDSMPWAPWFIHNINYRDCISIGNTACEKCVILESSGGSIERMPLPALPSGKTSEGKVASEFLRIQFKFEIVGYLEFRELAFGAVLSRPGTKKTSVNCSGTPKQQQLSLCPDNVFSYNAFNASPTYA